MDNMESATDDELIRRNERLLNLRELDLEIKQRELDLALHLNDLQEREAFDEEKNHNRRRATV